jgi:EMC6
MCGVTWLHTLLDRPFGRPNRGFEKPAVSHTKDPFRIYSSVCFFLLHTLVTLSIWAIKMKGQLRKFTRQSAFGFYTASIQPCLLSFTLFWTLFYGLVYLY